MVQFTEAEKQLLQSISIVEIMAYMGKRLEHDRRGMYYSPFRDEDTPSFHIDLPTNRWYDFGASEGGGLFEFVCKVAGCSRGEVYEWLSSFRNMVPECEYKAVEATVKKEKVSRVIIDSVSETFTRRKLIEYAESRAVPKDVLERYCDEVIYHIDGMPDRKFFAIGFRNNGGGYVLRSSVAKKCSTGDMTTLGPDGKMTDKITGDKVIVFEGFMDFLSWISHVKQVNPEHDCCILNSVANIGRALPWITSHSSIAAFMDNDKAGRDTLQKIIDNVPETAGDVCVYDMAKLYEGYNDLNEKLSDEMKGSEHSSINIHNHGDNTI